MFAIVSSIFAMIFMLFFDAILSVRLGQMGVAEKNIGFLFAIPALTYALSAPLIGLLCRKIRSMYVTQFSFLLAGVSLYLFGPS